VIPGPPPPSVSGVDLNAPRKTIRSTREEPRFERVGKPKVCVDLDGVLATPISGKLTEIGPPMPGALEFMRSLSERAEIIILTSRLATSGKTLRARREAIEAWLDEHGLPFDQLHTGAGKPVASAYVDDRAVPCRPLEDGVEAFNTALATIGALTGDSTDAS